MPQDSQTQIRLPKKLKERARIKAVKEGKSLSAVMRELLAEWVKAPAKKEAKEEEESEAKGTSKTE